MYDEIDHYAGKIHPVKSQKSFDPMEDFDTGIDCDSGMPAAIAVLVLITAGACIIGTLILISVIGVLARVGR